MEDGASMYTSHASALYRYIDDIFVIWDGPVTLLKLFLTYINFNNKFNLKFTMNYSVESITFLDLTISKLLDGYLVVYTENRQQGIPSWKLLASIINHLLNSILYGQYIRARRNCSTDALFEIEAATLCVRLRVCGYSNSVLKNSYHKEKDKVRSDLLFSHKQAEIDNPTPVVTQYTSQHEQLRQILLHIDVTLSSLVRECHLITFKRAPSLQDKLVHSELIIK